MNKTRIFLVFATLLLSGQSFAQTTKATIQGEISSSTANGLLGGTILNNIVLSYVDWTTCSGTGGIVYWNAGTPTCLNAGTNGYTLTMVSGIPQWTGTVSQSANTVYAGPSSGSPAIPSFRALVGSDLPNPSASTLGGVQSAAAVSHQWINSISTSGVPQLSQPAFTDISGTLNISAGGTNCTTASGTCLDNITGFATTGYISRTGSGTYAFSTVIPVASGGTSLAIGTSGGILGFTGTGTIASSGLLAQYGIVVGGGAGATPATLANGTAGQILQAQTSANPAWNTLSGDATIASGGAITVSASAITNSKLANAGAYTFKGNVTSGSAAPTDFTPGSLANKASPAAGDYIVIADNAASGALKYATVSSIGSAGSVSSIAGNTGAFTLGTGLSNSGNVLFNSGVVTVKKQTFTASGTYTPSTGMLYAIIECVGSGGGGGGVAGASNFSMGGGGGGSGGYSRATVSSATVGASQTVTIGAAGAASSAGASPGGSGGAVSVGTLCVANGGGGGTFATSATSSSGGTGGAAGTGDTAAAGAPGVQGNWANANIGLYGGAGGSSRFGGGANGNANSNGYAGNAYGSGGSGGAIQNNGSNYAGGAGSTGAVFITEYCSQ